jgi:hypothetical protein
MSNIDPYINIIIALLGLAYPILLQVIARLDEKYESENIATLFKTEWEWKAFRYTLVTSLLSIFIWSLNLQPIIEIDALTEIINNSAIKLVALNAIILVTSFFLFVNKVLKYYTPYSLIPYLISKHEKSDSEIKYFPALSDLLLLSIKKQQTNFSKTLSSFFYSTFRNIRDTFIDKPVIYPDQYYETVYKAIEELAIIKEKRNYLLEHRTSGGIWLLGEMQGKEISMNTYNWLWRNLLLAIRYEQDDLIINHWETCHQYYSYNLSYIHEEYNSFSTNFQVSNQEAVDKRNKEREEFIVFHYALGGLLTFKQRYSCIKRLFNYTQSQPATYELLPESMNEIFQFYFNIRDPYERKYPWISSQFPFPKLSGINSDGIIKKYIMSYMAILFLRQYSIEPHLITMKPLSFPPVPNSQSEIKKWIDGIDFFQDSVNEHLQNEELLKIINLEFISLEWCLDNQKIYPTTFFKKFKIILEDAYHSNAVALQLSETKISQFSNSTKTIIESAIKKLQSVNNITPNLDENSDKWYVNGERTIQSKDAFSENSEVHHMDFDSYLATSLARKINEVLCNVFFRKMTKSYLFKSEHIFKAIDKLELDDKYVIVSFGLNLEHYIKQFKIQNLSTSKYKNIEIHSFNGSHLVRDSLFIIKKSDLPNISTKPIEDSIIKKYSLNKISDNLNLYTSIIDLNETSDIIFSENKMDKSDDELRKSVLMNIMISTEFKWKRNIEVIQLKQYSQYQQRGILNNLDEIKLVGKQPPRS